MLSFLKHNRISAIVVVTAILCSMVFLILARTSAGDRNSTADTAGSEIIKIKNSSDLAEQIKTYNELIKNVGPETAQELLYKSGLPFNGQTHLLNHTVGQYLYKEYGDAGLTKCKDYFLSSCAHGFIIDTIASGGIDEVAKVLNDCQQVNQTTFNQCTHATGHGLLAYEGYANLTKALALCDNINDTMITLPIFACYDGVFMENIWGLHEGGPSNNRWVKQGDNNYPCDDNRIADKYLKACWANQPALVYQQNQNIGEISDVCNKVYNSTNQQACFNGLARQINGLAAGNADNIFNMCQDISKNWNDYCLVTNVDSAFNVGDRELPYQICAKIENSSKTECYQTLVSLIKNTPDVAKEAECKKIDDPIWQQKCIS